MGRKKTCLFPDVQTHGVWESKRLQTLPNITKVCIRDKQTLLTKACVQNLVLLLVVMDSICRLSEIDVHFATLPHEGSPGANSPGLGTLNTTENTILEFHDGSAQLRKRNMVSEHLGTRRIPKCIHILACSILRPHDGLLPQLHATILAMN